MLSAQLVVLAPAAAAARRLCTLAQVKAELGLAGASQDAELDSLRDQASAAIASWCNRAMAEETVRETWRLNGPHDGPLLLSRAPVTALSMVVEGGDEVPAADREHDADGGLLWRLRSDRRAAWTGPKVVAEYIAGWRVPDQPGATLPPDIERAAILLVAAMFLSRGRDRGIRSESVEGVGAISYLDPRAGHEQMPPEVAGLLATWRLPVL